MAEKPNIHAGHRERIRQRFREQGLSGFAEHEVLELLLTFAIARKDVNPLAHELIAQFGSLSAVLEADERELMRVNGVGENTAALLSMMPELFGCYQRSAMGEKPCVSNLSEAKVYCRSLFSGAHEELVYALCLDQCGRVLHPALLRRGTVNEVAIYPREVVEIALRHRAHAVLLTHNHPSGQVRPSQADIGVTIRIAKALETIGIPMLDHLIFAGETLYSMKSDLLNAASKAELDYRENPDLREDAQGDREPSLGALLCRMTEGE